MDPAHVVATTRAWVQRAVIGLNLCPFAKAVFGKGLIRYAVSAARDRNTLLNDLEFEMQHLVDTPASVATTLLIHPLLLTDFFEFNEFLDAAETLLAARGYTGVLQIASFHPHYQFAGSDASDITNATNRSPYPTLHLLREDSVEQAVAAFPPADAIYRNNMRTLTALGNAGWERLRAQWERDARLQSS